MSVGRTVSSNLGSCWYVYASVVTHSFKHSLEGLIKAFSVPHSPCTQDTLCLEYTNLSLPDSLNAFVRDKQTWKNYVMVFTKAFNNLYL